METPASYVNTSQADSGGCCYHLGWVSCGVCAVHQQERAGTTTIAHDTQAAATFVRCKHLGEEAHPEHLQVGVE